VFYEKSPRYIEPSEVAKIIRKLPPFVQSIGLFVNQSADEIDKIAQISDIDLAQIHFEMDKNEVDKLKTKHIKVTRATKKSDILKFENEYRIVDAFVDGFGGEGKRLNLEWFKGIDCSKIIIAGGLDANNLNELNGFGFYGVDVSSGVELSKGTKDHEKIINFLKVANEIS
jgi:phosphoribosylanthranilate isomerase